MVVLIFVRSTHLLRVAYRTYLVLCTMRKGHVNVVEFWRRRTVRKLKFLTTYRYKSRNPKLLEALESQRDLWAVGMVETLELC